MDVPGKALDPSMLAGDPNQLPAVSAETYVAMERGDNCLVYPTEAQERAYAHGLLLSEAAAEAWELAAGAASYDDAAYDDDVSDGDGDGDGDGL